MAILDLLKRNRAEDDEEEEEEVGDAEGDDDADDEDGRPRGGLAGRLGMLRSVTTIGGSAGGMLSRIMKRGGGDDEDEEDDDDEEVAPVRAAVVEAEPAEVVVEEGDGEVEDIFTAIGEANGVEEADTSSEEDSEDSDLAAVSPGDSPTEGVAEGDGPELEMGSVLAGKTAIDEDLRELASSLDDSKAEQLSEELSSLLNQVQSLLDE